MEKIKFLRPDIAIVFLRQHLELAEGGVVPEVDARPTIVAEHIDGKWHIVALQNTRISDVGAATRSTT